VTPADRAKLREVNIDANPLDALPLREMAEAIDDPFDDEQPQVCPQTRHPGAGAGAWRLRSFPGPLVLCPAATPQPQRWCRAERFCTLAEQLFRGRQPGGGCGSGGACGRRGRRPARGGGAGARTRRMRNSQRPGGLGQCLNSQENGTLDVLLRRTPGFRRHGSHASEGRGILESAWHLGRGILKRAWHPSLESVWPPGRGVRHGAWRARFPGDSDFVPSYLANALARLTPACGPPPRIPLVLAAVRGGFGPVLGRQSGRGTAATRPLRGCKTSPKTDLLLASKKRAQIGRSFSHLSPLLSRAQALAAAAR
jgi:hypothetical protein